MPSSTVDRIHILVVEDDPAVRSLLCQGFEGAGYSVAEAGSKASLLKRLEAEWVDLITLDLQLGKEDALELAREIRGKRNVPIMMITGRGEPDDRVVGLEHGADDYIVKPFNIREVLLRTHNLLERYANRSIDSQADQRPGPQRFEFDAGTLDFAKREMRDPSGEKIDLTDAELELLSILLRHPNRILSRDELSQLAFNRSWSPLERTVDNHIARLRKKIEPLGDSPTLIKSVRGVGYVLTADVRPV